MSDTMTTDTTAVRAMAPRASRYRRHATPLLKSHFVGPGHLVALCGAMLVLAVLMFPKEFINQQLRAGGPPQAATIAYLQLLLHAQPSDQTIRLQLVHERLRAGQLAEAEVALAPLIDHAGSESSAVASLWLSLRRAQFVAIPSGAPGREAARRAYANALNRLGSRLSPAGQLAETNHAIESGLYLTAARLAAHLLATTQGGSQAGANQSKHEAGQVASTSLRAPRDETPHTPLRHTLVDAIERLVGLVWASRTGGSAPPPAQLEVAHIHQRAFDALLQSHLAAGKSDEALRAAQTYLPRLAPQQVDWTRLIQIANWADKPAVAADFAQRWLASASDETMRWTAFQALIQAYLSAGKPRQALAAAVVNLHWISPSTTLWRHMTRLAMQAGDAEKSVQYARLLVGLEDVRAH